jgi:mycothiol system anti-sigma-R factor
MRGCDAYRADIQLYLDNELNDNQREVFLSHLDGCPSCTQELEAQRALSRVLQQARPLFSAPTSLRETVMQTLAEPAEAPAAPRMVGPRRLAVYPRWPAWGAIAAALLLCIALGLLLPLLIKREHAMDYVASAVAAHRGSLDGSLPLEVRSSSPDTVTAWFDGKVPFHFRLPSAAETMGHTPLYQLVGGRLVNSRRGHAALVTYQMQHDKISLLVTSVDDASAYGGEEVASGGITFHYNQRDNFHVITWSNHGLTYALVSSLPGSGRQACMVCHESMGNGEKLDLRSKM